MPASLTTHNLGSPEQSAQIRNAVTRYFEKVTQDWTVQIVGDQGNDRWEMKVSDGDRIWKENLEAGNHTVEAVLAVLNKMTR
jgi:hypothetical protein